MDIAEHRGQGATTQGEKLNRRYVVALGGGMAVEWFDFTVYGLLATYLGAHFFPSDDPVASTLSALVVFAVGFVARPLSAALFGPAADRIGHRKILLMSVSAMALSTLAIGVLPTYEHIGATATVLIVVARIAQGMSTGIEQAVGDAAAVEMAGPNNRAKFVTVVTGSILKSGILLASLVCFLTSAAVGSDAMAEWGWRIPFILGGVFGLVVLYLRQALPETGAATRKFEAPPSAVEVWRELWRYRIGFVAIIFVVAGTQVAYYAWTVGLPNLAVSSFDESSTAVYAITTALALLMVVIAPFAGSLCDRFTGTKIFTIMRLALAPSFFMLVLYQQPGIAMFVTIMLVGGLVLAFNQVLFHYIITTLMPDSCRTTGIGVGYGLGVAIFGGTSSYLVVWLQDEGMYWMFPVYGASLCLLSVYLYNRARRHGQVHIGE